LAEDSAEWLALGEQFGPGHRARIVEEAVNRLDKRLLEAAYRGVGSKSFRPELMLKIVLFEYLEGRRSPAQWARDTREHQALRWLGRGIRPSRSACYRYRDRMAGVIEAVVAEQLVQARAEVCVDEEVGVQDGTTFRACASRHRVVNRTTLQKRQESLEEALTADAAGQTPEQTPAWMAGTVSGRLEQAERLEQAREVLEQRIAENAKKPKDKRLDENRMQVSLSDPAAPLGRDKEKVFGPLYTVQFLVAPISLLIMAWGVFAKATDAGTLPTMIDRAQKTLNQKLKKVLADAAYATLLDLKACLLRGILLLAPVQENSFTEQKRAAGKTRPNNRAEFTWVSDQQTYLCPQGHVLEHRGQERRWRSGDQYVIQHRYQCSPQHCQNCPKAAECVKDPSKGRIVKRMEGQELLDAQREMMSRPEIKAEYKQRGQVIERTFADAKRHRHFRALHGRGLARATAEVGLLVLTQNTLALHRLRQNAANSGNDTS
jgi:transposase